MKTFSTTFLAVFLLWAQSTSGHSDFTKISFRSLTVEDGLSQSGVFAIEQDNAGYLWIGTADGLNRYDGYEFTHYRHQPGNDNSISDNFILCIEQANNGLLWIGTNGGGLNSYDPINETFTRYLSRGNGGLSSNEIYSVQCFKNKLFVGTARGLNVFDSATAQFKHYPYSETMEYMVSSFMCTEEKIFINTEYGILYLNEDKDELYLLDNKDMGVLSDKLVFSSMITSDKEIWVGTDAGLFVFDIEGNSLDYMNHENLMNSGIKCLMEDSEEHLWIGSTGSGIDIFDLNTRKLHHADHNSYNNMSVSDNTINCIFEDRSGVVWIGTYGGYLSKYDKYLNQFELYRHQKGNEHGLNSRRVFSLYEDQNENIWVGTDGGGLNKVSTTNNSYGQESYTYYMEESGLSSNRVWAIEPWNKNELFIGTLGGGLNLFNIETGKAKWFKQDNSNQYALSHDDIYCLQRDQNGLLWIGSEAGLSLFQPDTEVFTHYPIDPKDYKSFGINTVLSILHDSKGRHWIGSFGGGVRWFNKEQGFYKTFRHNRDDSTTLAYDKVMCIFEDSKGRIWIGTFGRGLSLYQEESQTFKHYTHEDGLPNDAIYGILEDENGNLWLSTNEGISCFNPEKEFFKNYDYSNNLQSDEFNQGAYYKGKSGRFYFGGINGFNAFKPSSLRENDYAPELVVNAFGKPGQKLATSRENGLATVEIRYPNNNIFFEFVAFNYVSSQNNKYKYKLEGLYENWAESGDHRVASFTNLPAGEYIFKTKASNNDGLWNENPAEIKLIVTAPLYKKSWFQPVLFILILGVVISITILVISNIRAKSRQEITETNLRASNAERESIQHQLTSLRAQMDPHFIFNSLNSIQHFIAQNETKQARQYLSKFATLIRRILNNSREETISVTEELDALKLYIDLEQLRFDNKFTYTINVDDALDPDEEDMPSMLIQPYVENAIIHGLKNREDTNGKLLITISATENNLKIAIEDNGVGRAKAREIREQKLVKYKSLGMSVTQSRLQLWSNTNKPLVNIMDLMDASGRASGTKVEISIKRGHLV